STPPPPGSVCSEAPDLVRGGLERLPCSLLFSFQFYPHLRTFWMDVWYCIFVVAGVFKNPGVPHCVIAEFPPRHSVPCRIMDQVGDGHWHAAQKIGIANDPTCPRFDDPNATALMCLPG